MPENIDDIDLTSIAVIGMSCRFPASPSVAAYWNNIANGTDLINDLSDEALMSSGISEDVSNSPGYIKRGSYLEEIEYFDAQLFDTTDREATIMAPSQRFLLVCAYEALEDAGYVSGHYNGRIGVYAGAKHCDSWQRRLYQLLDKSDGKFSEQLQLSIANDRDYSATRVSYKLNLKGPSLSINTACSTSLVAISQACKALLSYDCDLALAGGSSVVVPQNTGYMHEEGGIGARDGYCRPFDAKSSGTLSGNGAGVVLLKRLEEAIADRDNIQAIIRGSAINNDGTAKVGFTAPSVTGQVQVISDALAVANVPAESISYIETHGTATSLGDPIEMQALTQAFSPITNKKAYCAIGSVKSNMGHTGSAAGVASFIKTVQALKHKQIPPSLHFEQSNPEIDFNNSPFFVNTELTEWQRNGTPRRAGVSSFGVGGTNAHLILEEPPEKMPSVTSRDQHLILLSAKNRSALLSMEENLATYLKFHPEIELADVAYTLQVGREAYPFRSMCVSSNMNSIVTTLENHNTFCLEAKQNAPQKIAFMFPGQGAQHINMCLDLYRKETVFCNIIDRCAELLTPLINEDLREILYPKRGNESRAQTLLSQTAITQPALFVVEYALAQLWQSWGVKPDMMIGHSVGEYVAACLAGVFSLQTALDLIATRGCLMQSMPTGKMLAIQLNETELSSLLSSTCSIAAVNAENWCVASGPDKDIDELEQSLEKRNISCRSLHTSHAFHSPMMNPIISEFEEKVAAIDLKVPEIPFVSNVTGTWIDNSDVRSPTYWGSQLRNTVRFYEGGQTLAAENVILLEVGPGQTLSGLLTLNQHSDETVFSSCRAIKKICDDREFLMQTLGWLWLSGLEIDCSRLYCNENRYRISLPTYNFQKKRYWLEPLDTLSRNFGTEIQTEIAANALLGRRLQLPRSKELRFATTIGPESNRYLKSHKILDLAIIPEAHYLSMVLAAVAEALHWNACKLTEVSFHKPQILANQDSLDIQLLLTENGDDGYQFELIKLNKSGDDDNCLVLAVGQLQTMATIENHPNKFVFDEVKSICRKQKQDITGHVDSGNPWNMVRLSINGDDVVRLQWEGDSAGSNKISVYPELLAVCLKMAGSENNDDTTLVPVLHSLSELSFDFSRTTEQVYWCHINRKNLSQDIETAETSYLVDLIIADAEGNTLLELKELDTNFLNLDTIKEYAIQQKQDNAILSKTNEREITEKLLATEMDERIQLLTNFCREQVAKLIGTNEIYNDISLIEMGMDSLTAIELKTNLKNKLGINNISVTLLLEDNTNIDRLAIYLSKQLSDGLIADIDDNGKTMDSAGYTRMNNETKTGHVLKFVSPEPESKYLPFPLTDIQQAYWLGRDSFFAGGNITTHAYMEMEVHDLDPERYQDALNKLIKRHDMLRAIFLNDGSQQFLEKTPRYEVKFENFTVTSAEERESGLMAIRDEMSHQMFVVDQWPLFDIRVSKMENNLYRIHYSIDLLIIDFSSMAIFFKELFMFYCGMGATLPQLEFCFRDYVLAEQTSRENSLYMESEKYWLQRTTTLPPAPQVPLIKDPSHIFSPRFRRRESCLDPGLWKKLKEMAKQNKITPSVLLANAFSEVLCMWSQSPHFTLNLTIFNRLPVHEQANDIIGDFTSSILLEVDRSKTRTFKDNAKSLQCQLLKDIEHRFFSGIQMLRAMNSQQRSQQAVEIPIVLTSALGLEQYTNEFVEKISDTDQKLWREMEVPVYSISQTSQVWLDHVVWEKDGALNFTWDALEELFPEQLLDNMFETYVGLLKLLAEGEDNVWQDERPVALPAYQAEQRQHINQTETSFQNDMLHELFLRQVKLSPDSIAVRNRDLSLSYQELHRLATHIAVQLRNLGVEPNQLVAIVMEKGWQQLAAALGIMYSGAAYMPIDAGLPKERIWALLDQGKVSVSLTQEKFAEALVWPDGVTPLVVSKENVGNESPVIDLEFVQNPTDLAYVIFTSGSTGIPKGVMIDHHGAVNTILDINRRFNVTSRDKVIAISSLSFDLSVYDIFGLLAVGGTVVLPEAERVTDPQHWLDLIQNEGITIWNTVPALVQLLMEDVDYLIRQLDADEKMHNKLRLILMSGDWIPLNLPSQISYHFQDIEVISLGGATEASIWSIFYNIAEVDNKWKSIPYGTPLANQKMFVLHSDLSLCPDWVVGDIYISGIGLAKGYWRDQEKTATSFIINPKDGDRLYKTGDKGRYFPDGNIEFLGREDTQVKIQGHRIELGEIETTLLQYDGIKENAVLAVGDDQSAKHLVGFVVQDNTESESEDEGNENYLIDEFERAAFKMKQVGIRRLESAQEKISLPGKPYIDSQLLMANPSRAIQKKPRKQWSSSKRLITLNQLGGWLACLGQINVAGSALPKYYYPSAGSSYPIQIYLYIKPETVDGAMGGVYYYSPVEHELFLVQEDIDSCEENLFPKLKSKERLAVFVIANTAAIDPLYGQYGVTHQFCMIEFGHLYYMLSATAPLHGIELSNTAHNNPHELISFLGLDDKHLLLQSLAVGHKVAETVESPVSLMHFERQSYREYLRQDIFSQELYDLLSCFSVQNLRNAIPFPALYIYVKPKRVEGLEGGFYQYDFTKDKMVEISTRNKAIDDLHYGGNQKIFDNSAFSLLFVNRSQETIDKDMLMAGFISQALMTISTKSEIGLCSVGGFNVDAVRKHLQLRGEESPLYCIEGGKISQKQMEIWKTETVKKDIAQEWKEFLNTKLPYYMVPDVLIPIKKLPLTVNGKIDRKALLEIGMETNIEDREMISPRNDIEGMLLEIWKEILSMDELSVDDNLFELGGDSLMAAQLVSRATQTFNITIPLHELFGNPSIEGMAECIVSIIEEEESYSEML